MSLDGRRTRLHAKAWLFQRKTGFGSAYVGSAKLSGAALTGGLEWTVKLTQRAQEALFARVVAHFEALWADSEFQRFDPDNVEHRQAQATALGRESFGGDPAATISFFDLQPKTYQLEMLEQLTTERAHGRTRNLLVAATGTGKTVVAAFDYRNTCRFDGGRPRLLFVAHREEILRQAMRTYREVLRDPEFGDLLNGSHQPERWDHLFATIDSVTSRDLVATVGADHWHTVVVDECHRLAADRFDAFAKAVRPSVLLGLTATPESSDGQPIVRISMRGRMAAQRSNCDFGMRWTCSCWRRSSTTPATTPPTFRKCLGTDRESARRWTIWSPATMCAPSWSSLKARQIDGSSSSSRDRARARLTAPAALSRWSRPRATDR